MDQGNWVALDKNLARFFPDRCFSKIEAAFSLAIDYDNNNLVTIAGYAVLWGWSRSKVRGFFDELGIEVIYPENTTKKQKQKGQIKRQKKDRSETEKGQIRFVDNKAFKDIKDRKKTEDEQKKDRSKDTTIYPNNNPNTEPNKNKYPDDSKEYRMSVYLLNKIRERKPDFKIPDLQKWAQHADFIFRIDKRDSSEVKAVIDWCQSDEFWQDNILSTAKLRKQYDKLVLKMRKASTENKSIPKWKQAL